MLAVTIASTHSVVPVVSIWDLFRDGGVATVIVVFQAMLVTYVYITLKLQ